MSSENQDLESILTPEEIEAMNSPDDEDYDTEDLKAIAGEDDETEDDLADETELDEDANDESSQAQADAGQNEKAPSPAPVAQQADDNQDEPESSEQAQTRQFTYQAQLSEKHQEIATQVNQYEKDLKQKFRDGEIELDEYDEARDKIAQIRQKLDREALKAEISQEMGQQSAQQTWSQTVTNYLRSVRGEVDYAKEQDKAQDLDQFVKVLANNPAYATKPMDWFLSEAHKRVKALHGIEPAARAPSPAEAIAQAKQGRKPPIDKAPKTLAQVPGSDGPGDVDGEFAHIEALDGFEAEEAIARLSPSQRDRFLRG